MRVGKFTACCMGNRWSQGTPPKTDQAVMSARWQSKSRTPLSKNIILTTTPGWECLCENLEVWRRAQAPQWSKKSDNKSTEQSHFTFLPKWLSSVPWETPQKQGKREHREWPAPPAMQDAAQEAYFYHLNLKTEPDQHRWIAWGSQDLGKDNVIYTDDRLLMTLK